MSKDIMSKDIYYKKYIKYKCKYCNQKNKQNGGNVDNLETNNNVEFLNNNYTCYNLEKLEIDNYESSLNKILNDEKYEKCKMTLTSKLPKKYNCTTIDDSSISNKILCMGINNSLMEKFKKTVMTEGTQNVGNSCYVNSILHILLNTKTVAFYILNNYNLLKKIIKINNNTNNSNFELLIDIFYHKYNNDNSSVENNIRNLMDSFFGNQEQQDASEFLMRCLDIIDSFFKMNNPHKKNGTKLDVNFFNIEMEEYKYYYVEYEKKIENDERKKKKIEIINKKEDIGQFDIIESEKELNDRGVFIFRNGNENKNDIFFTKPPQNAASYKNYLNYKFDEDEKKIENMEFFLKNYTEGNLEDLGMTDPIEVGGDPLINYIGIDLLFFHIVYKFNIISYPNILIISIARFTSIWNKNTKTITLNKNDKQLNINNINHDFEFGNKKYNIYAFVIHNGTGIQGGHYICYIKNTTNQKWYQYNDSAKTDVELITIENEIKNAAIIFFHKK